MTEAGQLNQRFDRYEAVHACAGSVFDANIYGEALRLYGDRLGDFKQSNHWDQRSFWRIRIEEYLAALLGTAYLRRHAEGIGNKKNWSGMVANYLMVHLIFRFVGLLIR